jgi:hypothetical protein
VASLSISLVLNILAKDEIGKGDMGKVHSIYLVVDAETKQASQD